MRDVKDVLCPGLVLGILLSLELGVEFSELLLIVVGLACL
jgi:hypothetical protein